MSVCQTGCLYVDYTCFSLFHYFRDNNYDAINYQDNFVLQTTSHANYYEVNYMGY